MAVLSDTQRDAVFAAIIEAAEQAVLPRFQNLADHEIGSKSNPSDLVTIADREAEALLTASLSAILPGSVVVGEESVAANPALLDAIAREVPRRLGDFNPQELANTAWAFATLKYVDEKLFVSLAIVADRRLSEFNPQNVANTAWAFATVNYRDEKLFAALARAAERRLSEFNAQGIANMVWAFATVDQRHDALFKAMGDHIVGHDHLREFKPQEISNTVWAYATARVNHPQLFKKMANHMVGLDPSRDFNTLIIIIYPIPI